MRGISISFSSIVFFERVKALCLIYLTDFRMQTSAVAFLNN